MEKIIENKTFEEERELYKIKNALVKKCEFKGAKDGESPLKEVRGIKIEDSHFSLRYPLWHAKNFILVNTSFDELSRAPIWYTKNGMINKVKIDGVKALRESKDILIKNSNITSNEFGWKSKNISVLDSNIKSEYIFLDSINIKLNNVKIEGQYSFQYIINLEINNSYLDTKDAFWHSKNVVVRNSTIKSEYLAWYAENITFINCTIIGTQPICYSKKIVLKNCIMKDADLAFELSTVKANINGKINSVKNPISGYIKADSIGEIILDKNIIKSRCRII